MSGTIVVTIVHLCFSVKQSSASMKRILFFATLSLVMWVTLCLNNNQRENDEEEVFEEFLDRVKRDAMPQPRGMHFYFACIWLRSHRIPKLREVHSGNHLLCLHKRTIRNFKEQLNENETKEYF